MTALARFLSRQWRRLMTGQQQRRVRQIKAEVTQLRRQMEIALLLLGSQEVRRVCQLPPRSPLEAAEFKVFSQFGDDGILQYLFAHLPAVRTFIEFGVEDYTEANTRFLLLNGGWRGLILDGRPDLDEVVSSQGLPMLYPLDLSSTFITAENINHLFQEAGYGGEVGLLSIDIDGNDYWVWKAITSLSPQVVVVEYNALFGVDQALTIPYSPSFVRQEAHPSWLYFGASLKALVELGLEKGYTFVGCNLAGNNAYFVRRDLDAPFLHPTVEEGYRPAQFRESRDGKGRMNLLNAAEQLAAIAQMPVVDLTSSTTASLGSFLRP
jgi:hypothetical protein